MRSWRESKKNLQSVDSLIAATPDWEEAAATTTVIDVVEFEAAHRDPEWLAFCEEADHYVAASVTRELQTT
jgi:hypothetical protein